MKLRKDRKMNNLIEDIQARDSYITAITEQGKGFNRKGYISFPDLPKLLTDNPKVLETGTLRQGPNIPSYRQHYPGNYSEWIGTDICRGDGVDLVADLHNISILFQEPEFDLIISISTFEHLAKPWVAAEELVKILKPGGVIFVATHQTFPLHAYAFDYFRFSIEALEGLFNEHGMETLSAYYTGLCNIVPHNLDFYNSSDWNIVAESYLNVNYVGRKISKK
jgi:SAM-dependent methyltransferase